MNKDFITSKEAAKLLTISMRTVQLWVSKGILPAWKTAGGHSRILRRGVDKLLFERQILLNDSDQRKFLNLLVIEDDIMFLGFYKMWIKDSGFPIKLYTATNGYEGLKLQAGHHYL